MSSLLDECGLHYANEESREHAALDLFALDLDRRELERIVFSYGAIDDIFHVFQDYLLGSDFQLFLDEEMEVCVLILLPFLFVR